MYATIATEINRIRHYISKFSFNNNGYVNVKKYCSSKHDSYTFKNVPVAKAVLSKCGIGKYLVMHQ